MTWRLTPYLEHARHRVTGGTVEFGTRTFPESGLWETFALMMQNDVDLGVWRVELFYTLLPYCGFCANLLQPTA